MPSYTNFKNGHAKKSTINYYSFYLLIAHRL